MKYDNVINEAINEFPEILEIYQKEYDDIIYHEPDLSSLTYYEYEIRQKVAENYPKEDSFPLIYAFCETIVCQYFVRLIGEYQLDSDEYALAKIKKFVDFFERMAASEEQKVRNVLAVGIFEIIAADDEKEKLITELLKEKSRHLFQSVR